MSFPTVLIRRIEALGFIVSVHCFSSSNVDIQLGGEPIVATGESCTELHAVRLNNPHEQHVAKLVSGHAEEHMLQAACALAQMVGIRPQGEEI